jgi:hypothetical protein
MRLLPPREVETHTKAIQSAESQRITAIRSQLSREERDLNDWNDSIESKKRKAIDDFERKIMVFNQEIRKLQDEVSILEEKREILLRPLDDTPEIITERLAVTENLLDYLKNRKKEIANEKQIVEAEKKHYELNGLQLQEQEKSLARRELKVAKQETAVATEKEDLSESILKFTTESNRKNIELMLFKGKLNRHEVELAEREKLLAQGQEKIAIDRKRIESQQQSLIAAMAEIKNKN